MFFQATQCLTTLHHYSKKRPPTLGWGNSFKAHFEQHVCLHDNSLRFQVNTDIISRQTISLLSPASYYHYFLATLRIGSQNVPPPHLNNLQI